LFFTKQAKSSTCVIFYFFLAARLPSASACPRARLAASPGLLSPAGLACLLVPAKAGCVVEALSLLLAARGATSAPGGAFLGDRLGESLAEGAVFVLLWEGDVGDSKIRFFFLG
jgi:hypothetical protein